MNKPFASPGPWLFLLACAGAGILFLVAVPPWDLPDEPSHVENSLRVAGRDGSEEEIIRSMSEHGFWARIGVPLPVPPPAGFAAIPFLRLSGAAAQAGKRPPAYYLAGAFWLRFFSPSGPVPALYLLRVFSLCWHLLGGIFIYLAARRILPENRFFPAAAAAAAVLLPQALLIGVSASYESLLDAAAAAFFLAAVRLQFLGLSLRRSLGLVALAAAAAAVSPKGLFLLPLIPFSLALAARGAGRAGGWKRVLGFSGAALAFALALAAGLTWGRPQWAADFLSRAAETARTAAAFFSGETYGSWRYYPWFHRELFVSFFFKAGWAAFPLPPWAYGVFAAFSLAALAGQAPLLAGLVRARDGQAGGRRRAWAVLALGAVLVLLGFYLSRGLGPRGIPQGRHLLVGLAPWGILLAWGLVSWFPRRRRETAAAALFILFFLADLALAFLFLLPLYSS